MTVQLAAETSHFPLSAAFGTVTRGERADAKTRVRGINLADGAGAWAIGLQAWEGTREIPAATTKPWWDASSFGFTGREHDQGGLVYARHRYLTPSVGTWTRPDPLGQDAGPNYYAYVKANPVSFADPSGLMFATTLDAYAWKFPAAFIMLAADLGAVLPQVLMVGGTAVALTATISMNRTNSRERAKTDELCEPMPAPPRYATYYRGLSKDDLSEYLSQGVVRSKFYRDGLGLIMEGLERAVEADTAVHHVASGSWGSPLISVTTDWMQARAFANGGAQASGVTVRFDTGRSPMYKGLTKDEEWLFFWQLGFPGEQLTIAN